MGAHTQPGPQAANLHRVLELEHMAQGRFAPRLHEFKSSTRCPHWHIVTSQQHVGRLVS